MEENIGGTSSIDLLFNFGEEYKDHHFFLDRMALTVVFGLMSWSGQALNIGAILTGSVALGISLIALSLLLLYPAELLLISRFGWAMAALLEAAWVSSVLLLPALLAGPLGRLIENIELNSLRLKPDAP